MKKFTAILLCLLMIVTCSLAGCAGFAIDKVKYYNEVVATVGTEKITRFELVNAYNNYGQSYFVEQMGHDKTTAMRETLDMLVEREALYQYAKSQGEKYAIKENYQVNAMVKTVFENMDNSMEDYISTACAMFGIKVIENSTAEQTESEQYSKDAYYYTPRAEVVKIEGEGDSVSYQIKYIPQDTSYDAVLSEEFLSDYTRTDMVAEIIRVYFENLKIDLEDKYNANATKIYNKVRALLCQDLMSYEEYLRDENGKPYSKVYDDLIYRYFERNWESQIQSQFLTNIRTDYLNNEYLDINLLTEKFERMVGIDYAKYENNLGDYATKMKDIGTEGNTVLYHPENGEKFGYFLHILINFDEDQKAIISMLENFKEADDQLKEDFNIPNTPITDRAPHAELGEIKDFNEFVRQYNILVVNEIDYTKRLNNFIDLMFRCTGDADSTLKQGMPYAIGTESSAMVDEFNAEARKLMASDSSSCDVNKRGSVSIVNMSDEASLCISTYGVHVLFFVDPVDAYDADINDVIAGKYYIRDEEDKSSYNLTNKVLNPLTGEKYFHMLFDEVYPAGDEGVYTSNTGYTDFEKNLVSLAKNTFGIEYFTTKINATKPSI